MNHPVKEMVSGPERLLTVAYDGSFRDPALSLLRRERGGVRQRTATVLVAVLLVLLIASVAGNERFQWSIIGRYMFAPSVLVGALWTVGLTVICGALAAPLGIVLALMRLSPVGILRRVAWGYIWFFRSIPGLVQLLFWFNIAALYPRFGIGIPFGPTIFSVDANLVVTPFVAAIAGLTFHEAAYFAEIFRGSLMAVEEGQREAGKVLGLSPWPLLRRIVLPQAIRVAIPSAASQVIHLLKATSLVSVISMTDLLWSTQVIYFSNYQPVPLLLVASLWYLIITSILGAIQSRLERRFGRGSL